MKLLRHYPARRFTSFTLILAAISISHAAAQEHQIAGSVRDSTGASVTGATVTLHSAHSSQSTTTDSSGRFSLTGVRDDNGVLQVSAPSFAAKEEKWRSESGSSQIIIVLEPSPQVQSVIVSATRTEMKLAEVPGSAVLLLQHDIAANPSLMLDDLLRQVPGFSLFRRSGSRTANPTTQGVSLRGLGASGPSRALVLEDGVPIVDPFGGWVYWDRVPRAALSNIEVFRGGSSNLYGSDALGGVVQFLTRVPSAPAASVDLSYGSENTPDLTAWMGTAFSHWDLAGSIDMSRTDGFTLVPGAERGVVDKPANSRHATVDATAGYKFSNGVRTFLRGTFFDESRNNGTVIQKNSTGTGFGSAGINAAIGDRDWISARLYGQAQGYDQTFSSLAADRDSERLTNIQHVPSQALGGGAQWNHLIRAHTLISGIDVVEIMGASDEQLFSAATGFHFANNIAGGRQRSVGIFGEDILRVHEKWTIIAGLRWDDWGNHDGSTLRFPLPAGPVSGQFFQDRSASAFNPRLSILRELVPNVSVSLSAYRAFRAPTLNELYRSFRQGTSLTNANPLLRAERLTGAEAGVRVTSVGNRAVMRATGFWGDVVDPVTNVTLGVTPTLITKERQNLGRTRSVGLEFDGLIRVSDRIEFSGGYQYTHATVVESTPALIGLNIPEVPRHVFTWEARYWKPRQLILSVQGRYWGKQFDDDLNTLSLDRYYVMNLFAGREFRGVTGYIAVENLLDQRYPVASVPPIVSLGPPMLARVGLRVGIPSRK